MIRVTEVLDHFHEPWYTDWVVKVGKREANRVSKQAMKHGTRIDELIKSGKEPAKKDSFEVVNMYQAFCKWRDVYKPQAITPCERLYATLDGQEVTGEPDLMVDGVLVDIKGAARISLKYWIQVNMYQKLRALTINEPCRRVAILRLCKKTGSYEYVVKDYDPSLVDVWCGLMRAMVYLKGEQADGTDV